MDICGIDELLPEELLVHILSFLSVCDLLRTSILSRRWRNLWRYSPCLDFVIYVFPYDSLGIRYKAVVNNVIGSRAALPGLPSVKVLRIQCMTLVSHRRDIDGWLNFAISNQVETLQLELTNNFGPYFYENRNTYKLSEKFWYKAPTGLSSLKCLKSLFLRNVQVTKQFIEFIISKCLQLEVLSVLYAWKYVNLNVIGAPPLRLRQLKIVEYKDFALNKLCAPHLTSFYCNTRKFNPKEIDVPKLKDLAIGGFFNSQPIMKYLEPFWCHLPKLEKLELIMDNDANFTLIRIPELVKLKYLKITVVQATHPFAFKIIKLMKACPLLETFAFQVSSDDTISGPKGKGGITKKRRKMVRNSCFNCLKVLEVHGIAGKALDKQIIKIIINKSPHLEKLFVYLQPTRPFITLFFYDCHELEEIIKRKAKDLIQGSPREVEISVVLSHCHSNKNQRRWYSSTISPVY